MRIESALALVDELDGAEAPRAEQRRDAGRPRPLAHAVEDLAVAHVVAVDELLVREQIAVRVHDALGQPGRARRVVELGRVLGQRVLALERGVAGLQQLVIEEQYVLDQRRIDAVLVRRVRDEDLGLRVADAVTDAVVAVQHRHREQDRAALPGAEERGRGLGRRGEQHRDTVALLYTVGAQHVREPVRELLQLAPLDAPDGPVEVLVDHRELVRRVLVADVLGDVVALGDVPLVVGDSLLVGRNRRRAHGLLPRLRPTAQDRRLWGTTDAVCGSPRRGRTVVWTMLMT